MTIPNPVKHVVLRVIAMGAMDLFTQILRHLVIKVVQTNELIAVGQRRVYPGPMPVNRLLVVHLHHRVNLLYALLEILHGRLHLLLKLVKMNVVLDKEGVELAEGYGHLSILVIQVFHLEFLLSRREVSARQDAMTYLVG